MCDVIHISRYLCGIVFFFIIRIGRYLATTIAIMNPIGTIPRSITIASPHRIRRINRDRARDLYMDVKRNRPSRAGHGRQYRHP